MISCISVFRCSVHKCHCICVKRCLSKALCLVIFTYIIFLRRVASMQRFFPFAPWGEKKGFLSFCNDVLVNGGYTNNYEQFKRKYYEKMLLCDRTLFQVMCLVVFFSISTSSSFWQMNKVKTSVKLTVANNRRYKEASIFFKSENASSKLQIDSLLKMISIKIVVGNVYKSYKI